jgi:drug/metabolite transporter (DMT)-like permease
VLLSIIFTASFGDVLLSHGMKQIGEITLDRLDLLFLAPISNPFVGLGVLMLIAFFAAYLTALSWADLTYVLPSTAMGYVVVALLGKFWLHENVSFKRWLGILLIVLGTGFVAGGPSLTEDQVALQEARGQEARGQASA